MTFLLQCLKEIRILFGGSHFQIFFWEGVLGRNSNFLIYTWGEDQSDFWPEKWFFLIFEIRLDIICTPSRYRLSLLIIWVFITVVNSEDPCRYKNLKVIHIVQKDWDLVRYELTWSSKEDCVYNFYYDSWKSLILFIDIFLSVIFVMFPTSLRSMYTIPRESCRYAFNNSEWVQDKIYLDQ